jgi:ATP-dependent DNA helicase PIF1
MDLSILSPEQRYAFAKFRQGENVFVTGPGGTGKTRLIEYFVRECKSKMRPFQVCAMTGCAAILLPPICNARTVHSWSGIRLCKGPNYQIVTNALKNKSVKSAWRKVKTLIIDEVSMMSVKVLEVLDAIAKAARANGAPFGGIQVIFAGDFYQLPPVGNMGDITSEQFCFESSLWSSIFPYKNNIELKTIFRQTDPIYKEILLQIRTASLTENSQKILEKCVKRDFKKEDHNGCVPTKLYPTRAKTDYLNNLMFSKLEGKEYEFACVKKRNCKTYLEADKPLSLEQIENGRHMTAAEIDYEMQQLMSTSSFQEVLLLKEGAVVMCTVNLDMDQGICNGSQGVIVSMIETSQGTIIPEVRFTNGVVKRIPPHYRQSEEYPTIAIGQIPLCLAWALTIHKIQGATLSMADIDVGGQIFEYGQTYVALSRVESLNGLYLSAFQPQRIRANERVTAFYAEMPKQDYVLDIPKENPFENYEYSGELAEVEISTPAKLLVVKNVSTTQTTHAISFDMFLRENKTLDEIAKERCLKPDTIMEHILKHLPNKDVAVHRLISNDIYREIKAAYDVAGQAASMKFIKDSLRHSISYNEIKLVRQLLFGSGDTIVSEPTNDVKVIRL